ncbi:non-heme iron oxygenase ferredoxin subunit [Frateuria aurantia]
MSDWVMVATRSELLPGEHRVVWDGDTGIVVYNIEGELYAIEDQCTHDALELSSGEVEGHEVICPWHGARFDLRTGAALCAPAYEPVASFPVKEEHGAIWTRDNRQD